MSQFISRMIRAAMLDATLYDEVKADSSALGQAIGVVFLTYIAGVISSFGREDLGEARELIADLIFWFICWLVGAVSLYFVGTEFTGEERIRSKAGAMLRTLGFASLPFMITILIAVPGISVIVPRFPVIVKILAMTWVCAATVVAVRRTLDIRSIGRTIGVFVIAWFGGGAIMFALVHAVYIPLMR